MALDSFARVQGGKPSPLRNRIEHSQIVTLEDIPRFAELGVIASMQATHATSDKNMAEDRIGPDRILGGYAWRRMLDAGVVLANGSDFPVELSNPFHGLYASVTRQGRDGEPDGGWYADQALTRAEALHSFTLAAAYAARQEDRLGSLEPGKWADFIIIDRDFFTIPASEIDDIVVLETWVGGQQAYQRQEDSQ
jgi:predicted amidohydrolase YtcJ